MSVMTQPQTRPEPTSRLLVRLRGQMGATVLEGPEREVQARLARLLISGDVVSVTPHWGHAA